MTNTEILSTFEKFGVILKNRHLVYTSGRHGDTYVNKDAIYPHTSLTSDLCLEMARKFEKDSIDVVVGPALGGILLSQWVAYHLSQLNGRDVLSVYAEKAENGFVLRRGYENLVPQKRILLVEDILTTGGSLLRLSELTKSLDAEIVGAATICNRGGVSRDILQIPRLESLLELSIPSWLAADCPLCKKGMAIDPSIGKRMQ